jgi:chorismate-pyruvate lyase
MTAAKLSTLGTKLVTHQLPDKLFLGRLSRFQRLLLTTDGTVTEFLEHYLDESIEVSKLFEKIEYNIEQLPLAHENFIHVDQMPVLKRKILLQGLTTKKNWIYAESSILLNHLPEGFRTDLLSTQHPIGKLWVKYKTETYKVILHCEKIKANTLANYFDLSINQNMLSRTYGVYSKNRLIMVITETFPDCFFID